MPKASEVRIVVVGDDGTGKSSLIHAAAYNNFKENLVPVLPPKKLPVHRYRDRVKITLIDTSSRVDDNDRVVQLQRADSVILTYACYQPDTFQNLSTFWLPHLRQLEVKAPVIVVGCMLDLQYGNQKVNLEQAMPPLMQEFREIEAYIQCSAYRSFQVFEVFYLAQKNALYPLAPLFDKESQTLQPRLVRDLKRIFTLCDHDKDGALSDAELDAFQVKCFNTPLQASKMFAVKRFVQNNLPDGVNERGLSLAGFLFLHSYFVKKMPREEAWTVVRKFGYNDDIKLADGLIPPLKCAPHQSVELTNEAIHFLETIFDGVDGDFDKVLQPHEIEELFSTAPESPWIEYPYKDTVERNAFGGISLDAFLSEWALMTLLNPKFCVENLVYMGFRGDLSSAIRVTGRRHMDRKKQQSERNVLQCFIFGPMKAGKSALLNYFIGRPHSEAYNPTDKDRYAVNVVDISTENKKYLVLREISESGVTELLANKESLASCDIAVFVHDRSDESSWEASSKLLLRVAGHGKDTGFQVPCLVVAAQDDQDSFTMTIQEANLVRQDIRVEDPMLVSVKLGDLNNIFHRIVTVAETGTTRRQYHGLINQSLVLVSAGVAMTIGIVLSAMKNASRKNNKVTE